MTVRIRILIAGAGSAAILLGALVFQFFGELPPCPLCIYQRWPHAAAVVLAALGVTLLKRHGRLVSLFGALAMSVAAGIAIYHFGIEHAWWRGPDSCTSGGIPDLSTDQLLAKIMETSPVRCDEIQWEFVGLTLAGWNALISLGLAAVWLSCAVLPRLPYDSSSASQ